MPVRYLLVAVIIALLAGCDQPPAAPLDQQVYIWQRQWRAEHAEALSQSKAEFSTLRVLALQAQPKAGWGTAYVDLPVLKADGRPVIAVVRIDGQLPALDLEQAKQRIGEMLAIWQAAGVPLAGVEIDHDCATSRLPAYQTFLEDLRSTLPGDLKLSITALPAWLDSPALPALLSSVDSSVLQVHAVSDPRQGLFDPQQTRQWVNRWSKASAKPFYLALPAYGVGLLTSDGGAPLVESEAPLETTGTRRELMADPQQLSALRQHLMEKPPEHLAGLIWFRLPLPGDRRAWSLTTLKAVVRGETLSSQWSLELPLEDGLYAIRLTNEGNLDSSLPQRLTLAVATCEGADAVGGYGLQQAPDNLTFLRLHPGRLAAGATRVVGWARCHSIDQGASHVYP